MNLGTSNSDLELNVERHTGRGIGKKNKRKERGNSRSYEILLDEIQQKPNNSKSDSSYSVPPLDVETVN